MRFRLGKAAGKPDWTADRVGCKFLSPNEILNISKRNFEAQISLPLASPKLRAAAKVEAGLSLFAPEPLPNGNN